MCGENAGEIEMFLKGRKVGPILIDYKSFFGSSVSLLVEMAIWRNYGFRVYSARINSIFE